MLNKTLTAIIPFLNEKSEVENTVKSIKEHSNGNIEILLINDASDDDFDYKFIAEKYGVTYVENTERMGVAASRDLGVELCQTPYFLLLDAHMRFYDSAWIQRIIEELDADQRSLLCCQTKALEIKDDVLTEDKERSPSYGACIELDSGLKLIEPFWIFREPEETSRLHTIPIVCVLGAGYACSKTYWQYLKGLEGLKYYGSDEPYISIKVWLEGGSCKLLKDVVIGHIYRSSSNPPYVTDVKFRIYNRLFIIESLIPDMYKKNLIFQLRLFYKFFLSEALFVLYENRELINHLRNYYQQIFTRDFSFFETLNNQYYKKNWVIENPNDMLRNIVSRIENEIIPDIGILNGRMGIVIFLFHYSRFSSNDSYKIMADKMLSDTIKDIKADTHYGFSTGLSGIGWGIEYLHQHGFVEGDTNEILSDFDEIIVETDPKRIVNLNRDYGLGGIVLYLLARLYTIEKEKKDNPFDKEYLLSVCNRICSVIEQRDSTCNSIEIFLDFLDYYQGKKTIAQPEIYDVWHLRNSQNVSIQELELGLSGASGVGIRLMLEKERD